MNSEVEIEMLKFRVKQLEDEIERLMDENQKMVRYILLLKVGEQPGITSEQEANLARAWDELERTEKDARAYVRRILAAEDETLVQRPGVGLPTRARHALKTKRGKGIRARGNGTNRGARDSRLAVIRRLQVATNNLHAAGEERAELCYGRLRKILGR